MTSNERHNEAMQRFIRGTLREMVDGSRNFAEMMVMLESIIYGCMLLTIKVHGESPQVATGLAEAALAGAIVRLAEGQNKEED